MPKSIYYTEEQEQIARIAKALGNPTRIAILQLLSSKACCYHGDMAEELPIAKSTLSQHLNELKNAGLIQGDITPQLFSVFFSEVKSPKAAKNSLINIC